MFHFSCLQVGGINITTTSTIHHDTIELDDTLNSEHHSSYPHRHHYSHHYGAAHNLRHALTPRRASRGPPVVLTGVPPLPTDRDLGVKPYVIDDYDGLGDAEEEKIGPARSGEISPNTMVSLSYSPSRSEGSRDDRTIALGHHPA